MQIKALVSVLLLSFITSNSLRAFKESNFDYKAYIEGFGYTLETYEVTTEDDYINTVWHLVKNSPTSNASSKVVFFQHGLLDTAWTWFQLKENSIPFLLGNEGHDVWLGNSRGNIFSFKHKTFDPSDINGKYWDFCMDEKAKYDIPAFVSFVKQKTGAKKISYIGHSQGTTIFLMKYMSDPTWIEANVENFVALGTVPNLKYSQLSPLKLIEHLYSLIKLVIPIKDIAHLSEKVRNLVAKFAKNFPNISGSLFEKFVALTPSHRTDYNELYKFMYFYPGGTSKKNLLHWSQIYIAKKLVYYNPDAENEGSGSESDDYKAYDINVIKKWKINSLVARTDDDTLSTYQDVTELYEIVENKDIFHLIDLQNYNHADCIMAESAIKDIFEKIINFIK